MGSTRWCSCSHPTRARNRSRSPRSPPAASLGVSLGLQLATHGDREASPTLIFDEVDTGIGGAQAAALGRKLRRLAA